MSRDEVNRDGRRTVRGFGKLLLLPCVLGTTMVIGCGGDANVAPVSGIVKLDGKPLPGGRIMFEPLATGEDKLVGKPAFAEIQSDGSFVLSTFGDGDGAVIGKHHPVVFGNRVEEDPNSPNRGRTGPNIGVIRLEDLTLEVVAGQQNEFTIEVKSRSADVRGAVRDD